METSFSTHTTGANVRGVSMKNIFFNLGYFIKEAMKIIKFNLLSNIFSLLGTGLILFLLGMVLVGGSISNQLVENLKEEAEVSAYFDENMDNQECLKLVETVKDMDGVRDALLIDETDAYNKMEKVLGEEAKVLALFDENPFEAYIEIRIHLDTMDSVLEKVENLEGVNYVRDNRAVLERMQAITEGLKFLGYLVIVAVGITTLVIISHMIRQGIYNNKDQINTLRLLGAPNSFIGFPYVIIGLLLTMGGGILAIALIVLLINQGYGQVTASLSFIPLPPSEELISEMVTLLLGVSILLGILGSLFGLSSIKKNR